MSNPFRRSNQNLSSGENTKYKKQKTIFKGAIDVAKNGGKLIKGSTRVDNTGKKHLFKQKGTYVGNIYTSEKHQKLIGANSYEALLDVHMGKYLADPLAFGISNGGNLYEGLVYFADLSGLTSMAGTIIDNYNSIIYPPDPNSTSTYPDPSNIQAGGVFIDPSLNYMVPDGKVGVGNQYGACYLFDENAWLKHVTYQQAFTKRFAYIYEGAQNGIISPVIYPASCLSLNCDEYWKLDVSNGIVWNGFVPGYAIKGIT